MLKAGVHTTSGRASLLPQILSEKLTKNTIHGDTRYTNFSHHYDLRSYLFTMILSAASQKPSYHLI